MTRRLCDLGVMRGEVGKLTVWKLCVQAVVKMEEHRRRRLVGHGMRPYSAVGSATLGTVDEADTVYPSREP